MVKVDSADAICEKVKSLGGRARPAFDIKEQGRMAECFDPNGAEFDIWEPKKAIELIRSEGATFTMASTPFLTDLAKAVS